MFFSTATNGIDAKGRVSVPADFRAAVASDALNGVFVWRSFNGPFLEGGGEALMAELSAAIDAMDPYDDSRTSFERVIFGGARPLTFDANGRVTLPKDFAEHAGLADKATFVGMGRRFEIWNPDAHAEQHAAALDFARENKHALRRPPRRDGEGA
ncbi:division/cell wall cluster transcriptional repressor MraZ [Marinicauda salina]|uniref:Transcriptional regulator MraZ n=2 Tax=Marinicauda salina TaxID=2135793 RepID=A0A2U2BUL5_9PROT|nr:division/cell wall cluster transcriptional repressor MraZ [Marinicauda salina]